MSAVPVPAHGVDNKADFAIADKGSLPPRTRSAAWMDAAFEWLTKAFAILVLSLLAAILISLVMGSTLTLQKYGLSFIWREDCSMQW